MRPLLSLKRSQGRIEIRLSAHEIGNDLLVAIYGGTPHIGAVALSECGALAAGGHREAEIAGEIADTLSARLGRRVAVVCGIHYDRITKAEIVIALNLARELADALVWVITGAGMLKISDLEEFEKYLKSGRFEAEFKCSPEHKRHEMLELLEKLMDVSDLADEVATRIIYRGMAPEKS